MTADGQTITANAALAVLDNGLSVSLTANDGTDDVSMAATFTEEDGVTITDTEALQATLLRDVVKNAVTLFYSASQATEEATSAAAE